MQAGGTDQASPDVGLHETLRRLQVYADAAHGPYLAGAMRALLRLAQERPEAAAAALAEAAKWEQLLRPDRYPVGHWSCGANTRGAHG